MDARLTPDDLIGPKRNFSPVKSWFQSWEHGVPSTYPLIIVGDAGSGKTTVAHAFATQAGFDLNESHAEDDRDPNTLKTLFSDARKPSFFGQRRCVVIEDIEALRRKEWAIIRDELKRRSIPIIIIAYSEADVEWAIRRNALVHLLPNPSIGDRRALLTSISGDESDLERIEWIAEHSQSWRSARLLFETTPPDWSDDLTNPIQPMKSGFAQVQSILRGDAVHDLTTHPLSLIQAAEWNLSDPESVCEGLRLYSQAWAIEGLSEVATAYLKTLRSTTTDRPPFRKRQIRGSVRHV